MLLALLWHVASFETAVAHRAHLFLVGAGEEGGLETCGFSMGTYCHIRSEGKGKSIDLS